jgi:hypothetical protein
LHWEDSLLRGREKAVVSGQWTVGEKDKEEPQAARQENPPFIPLYQRGKEGDLNFGARDWPQSGREKAVDSGQCGEQ